MEFLLFILSKPSNDSKYWMEVVIWLSSEESGTLMAVTENQKVEKVAKEFLRGQLSKIAAWDQW